jgi:hypothetical protein
MCAAGYLGPSCQFQATATNTQPLLANQLTLSYMLDPANQQLMHFRMDSMQVKWISFMIIATGESFMAGDSATAYKNGKNQWVVEDQYGHPYNADGMSDTVNGGQQNLMNGIAWQPTTTTLSATWSRLLNTGDMAADKIIMNGEFSVPFCFP